MKYTIEFELPNNKTIEDELQGSYVSWSIWGYAGVAKAKPVEEPKKGRWKRNDNGTYSCSRCQSWIPEEQHYYACYCIYCGAKMEVTE